jgi:hypothetical protein
MPTEIKKLDLASIRTTSSSDNNVLVVNNGEVAFANELFVSGLNVTGDFNISGRIFQSGEPFVGGGGGDLTSVATNVIPAESGTLDLGTASKPWRDLYVSTGTIHLGEETIKVQDQKIVFSKDIRVKHDGVNLKRLVRENETGIFAEIFAEAADLEKTDANLASTGENLLGQITSNDSDLSNVASNLVSSGQNLQANISTNVGAIASNVSAISSNTANLAATGQTLQREKLDVIGGTISGEILPYESGAVNLGSPLLPFRSGYFDDLIVSADSIQIGPDTTLSATAEGGMSFDTVGTITFGDVVVTGDLGVSGDFTLGDKTTDRITTRGDLFVQDDAFFADAVEITGSLTVDGTASAATPTQNSHLTTKLYVDTDITIVSGLITNNDTELNSLRTATGVLKTSTDNNATNIASNDSDISTLTTNLASSGQNLQANISTNVGAIASNVSDISTLTANLASTGNNLQAQVISNDGDISTLTSNLISTGQTLQTQITSNDSDISTITSNLVSTGQTLNTDIITVSGLITNNDTELSDIRTATGVLKTSTDNNATNIASNDSDIATLTTSLASTGSNLQAQVTSLSGDAVLLAGNQTVAGNKTFSNDVTVLGDLAVSGDFTLGDATTDRITTRGDLYVEDDAVFSDDITVTGDAYFNEYLFHNGDNNTYIRFAPDLVNIVAGGWSALKFDKSTSKIQLNNGNQDLDLQVMADDGEVILHTDAGTNRVGIGTDTPGADLVVQDGQVWAGVGATKGYDFHDFGTGWGYKGMSSPSRLAIFTNANERVTILSDGKVGIGTTTPDHQFDLTETDAAVNLRAIIQHTGSNQAGIDFKNSAQHVRLITDGTYPFRIYDQGDSADRLIIDTSGNVNIVGGNFQMGGTNIINSGLSMYNLESFKLADNKKAYFGSSNDLEIYHNGSHSYISHVGSGALKLKSADFRVENASSNNLFKGVGSVASLYFNGSEKLATNSGGVTVTGTAILGGASFVDNATAYFGTGLDLRIYHDGNNSFIKDTGTGGLYIYTNTLAVTNAAGSENMIYATENGAVTLYYDNAVKLATASTGVSVTGLLTSTTATFAGTVTQTTGDLLYSGGGNWDLKHTVASQNIVFSTTPSGGSATERVRITHDGHLSFLNDTGKIKLGAGGDLQIYHNGTHSYIDGTTTGDLYVRSTNDDVVIQAADDVFIYTQGGEDAIIARGNGEVSLFYDNVVKLATTATGVNITGQLSATTKSFLIDHPTKPGKKLRHGSLEGPENGVYIRGKGKKAVIELPEYWTELVDEDSITVQLTPIGKHQHIYVESIKNNAIHIQSDEARKSIDNLEYYYLILAERKDVNKLTIEE